MTEHDVAPRALRRRFVDRIVPLVIVTMASKYDTAPPDWSIWHRMEQQDPT